MTIMAPSDLIIEIDSGQPTSPHLMDQSLQHFLVVDDFSGFEENLGDGDSTVSSSSDDSETINELSSLGSWEETCYLDCDTIVPLAPPGSPPSQQGAKRYAHHRDIANALEETTIQGREDYPNSSWLGQSTLTQLVLDALEEDSVGLMRRRRRSTREN
jgi:hypothetical protein